MEKKRQTGINRRDFLKLAAGISLVPLVEKPGSAKKWLSQSGQTHANIIILVLDALSARHLSLYGYPRNTSPNIDRFAERAAVFHNHHSAANFTTPSTASLLTGKYPWGHHAYTLRSTMSGGAAHSNIFRYLRKKYHTAAFSQNLFADKLLFQFERYLDRHQPADSFNFSGRTIYTRLPGNEAVAGFRAYDQFMLNRTPPRGSLFLSLLHDFNYLLRYRLASRDLGEMYPLGMPSVDGCYAHFTLEEVMDGVISLLDGLPTPFLAYLHLLPPHQPYRPNSGFRKLFNDGWEPPPTSVHPLGDEMRGDSPAKRQPYDEFIANIDSEVGRLLEYLQSTGLLDKSYFILTSDHGELFERGHIGHYTPLLFEPLLHIPLVIASPGQKERIDIRTPTSSIDLFPTLLAIAGVEVPTPTAGQVLPLETREGDHSRDIWALEAKNNSTFGPLNQATLALYRGNNKLVYYHGYKNYKDQFEFYDLDNDPDELENRYPADPAAAEMQAKLEAQLNKIRHQVR